MARLVDGSGGDAENVALATVRLLSLIETPDPRVSSELSNTVAAPDRPTIDKSS
jgi:hypothetical protein